MYDYIIKTYDERTLYFFEKDGICVKDLSVKINKYKVIYEDGIKDFAVEDLGYGQIGIVCQNKEGSIVFLKEDGENYLKTILLNNKSQVYYDKYFELKLHGNWLGLSYIIEYNNNNILSFQIVNVENEPPLAVDYVSDKTYFSFVDENYDRIFFYNKAGEFGYKIYKWSKKNFTDYDMLSTGQLISAINDFSGNYYIIFLKDNRFFLKTLKNKDGIFNGEEIELDFIELFDRVNLMIEDNNLWIVVKRYNFTFGRKTKLDEISFSPQYNFFSDGEIVDFRLSVREQNKKIERCFGNVSNIRPELILYKDIYNFKKSVKVGKKEIEFDAPKKSEENIRMDKLEIRINELEKQLRDIKNNNK